ncbi:MAG: TIGR04255 family protein [Oscillospiraceae bacterium]
MLFSHRERCSYAKSPLHEVICQLRFPTILAIDTAEPAALQEAVRGDFPRYAVQKEQPAPQIVGVGTPNPRLEQAAPVTNYNFVSTDNLWKINLTRNFIAFSTLSYHGWEDFGKKLDKPLAQFIRIYSPAFFERIGLRYVNITSRKALGLGNTPWAELFTPAYAGILTEEDVRAEAILASGVDFTLKLDSSCQGKIHAGPGMLKANTPEAPADTEQKFILDMDLSLAGNIPPVIAAGGLETLHGHATTLFEGAITDVMRAALSK